MLSWICVFVCLFIVCCYTRFHEFIWHGSNRSDPGRYIPGKNKFIQLRHVPSHLYCSVRDVRTNDISVITVKLMIFFQLADVERMVSEEDLGGQVPVVKV